ncbi:LysR family transcriptional regulator [Chakrabartia godavariana]|nr:LysR family transcriptional regulator [Chakrabartia godavariana]
MVSDAMTLSGEGEDEVLQLSARGVHPDEHRKLIGLLDKVNWSDLDILRRVADQSSLRRASQTLGMSVNTIRSRLNRLEKSLETVLFARSRDGLKITAEGQTVLRVANEMRLLSVGLPLARGNHVLVRDGEVRICASEGVGTFWLTPRLPELKARLPEHVVVLDALSDQTLVTPVEHDVAVGFQKPADLEAICSKLATIHVIPFASDQYLRQHGTPAGFDDLHGHQFVQQDSPGTKSDAINLFLTQEVARKLISIRVSSSFSHYWAVANGVGIGALPTYARAITKRVRPIDLPVRMRFELWLSYRREARNSQPVQQVVQWLRDSFDGSRYPWFADHFVHPDAFGDSHGNGQIVSMFDHLMD